MADSRCQKNFYTDSALNRGSGKRSIRPQRQNENDFFTINYGSSEQQQQSGYEAPIANGGSHGMGGSSVPWGTSEDMRPGAAHGMGRSSVPWGTNEDMGSSGYDQMQQQRDNNRVGAAGDVSRKQQLDQNAHAAMAAEMNKVRNFYDQNPDYKLDRNYHREAMLAEKNKPVPWGTLSDLDGAASNDQTFGKKKGTRGAPAPAPAPFATAFNDEFPGKERKNVVASGQPPQSMVQSQITF